MKNVIISISILLLSFIPYSNFSQGDLQNSEDSSGSPSPSSTSVTSYTHTTTPLVIPAIYGEVGDFVNGFTHVRHAKRTIFFITSIEKLNQFKRERMYDIIINKQGRQINNEKYYSVTEFSDDGYACVRDIAIKGNNKSAIIDNNGNIIFPFRYPFYRKFYKGTVPVLFNSSQWGFIRRYGHQFRILPGARHAQIQEFSEGLVEVQVYTRDYTVALGYADINGKLVIPAKYSSVESFSEGLAAVKLIGQEYYGYINKTGIMVIPPRFLDAKNFHNGLAKVALPGSNKYGYINKNGNIVIQPKFEQASDFSEGIGVVYSLRRFYFINKTGEKIFNQRGYRYAGVFREGLAPVMSNSGKYGFINKQGQWAIPPQFEEARSFSNAMAAVKINGKWGFIAHP